MLLMLRRYYPGQNTVERDASSGAAALQYQDDPIVHELFIAAIRLINFFCKNLEKLRSQTEQQL